MVQTKENKKPIILIYPKTGYEFFSTQAPPHGLLAIAAHLKKEGFNPIILDQRIDEKFNQKLDEIISNALFVGISSMTGMQLKYALEITERIKEKRKNLKVIWGGIHPTIRPKEVLENKSIDLVVVGEGEKRFVEIANILSKSKDSKKSRDKQVEKELKKKLKNIKSIGYREKNKIIINPKDKLLLPKEFLRTPWELIDLEKYINKYKKDKKFVRELDIGMTSKGCPGNCYFCYNLAVNKAQWRGISANEVVERISEVVKNYSINFIILRDDDFFADINRVRDICQGIIKHKLNIEWYSAGIRIKQFKEMPDELLVLIKKSGCTSFRFGAESGSAKILKEINKEIIPQDIINSNIRCKKFGIIPNYSFMMGFPKESLNDIMKTVDMLDRLKEDNPKTVIHGINILTPYPGTAVYSIMKHEGMIEPQKTTDWLKFHHMTLVTPHFTEKEKKEIRNINELSYMTSEIAYKSLKSGIKPLAWLLVKWAQFRWKRRMFSFAPELTVIKFLRKITLNI